jgi:hypothetical protein
MLYEELSEFGSPRRVRSTFRGKTSGGAAARLRPRVCVGGAPPHWGLWAGDPRRIGVTLSAPSPGAPAA